MNRLWERIREWVLLAGLLAGAGVLAVSSLVPAKEEPKRTPIPVVTVLEDEIVIWHEHIESK